MQCAKTRPASERAPESAGVHSHQKTVAMKPSIPSTTSIINIVPKLLLLLRSVIAVQCFLIIWSRPPCHYLANFFASQSIGISWFCWLGRCWFLPGRHASSPW